MADMSQVNLERLRGCDAMWEETKHPRADNGQFTSGSGGGGAKVTKATPGMAGGKFQTRGKELSANKTKATAEKQAELTRNENVRNKAFEKFWKNTEKAKKAPKYYEASERLQNMNWNGKQYGPLVNKLKEKGDRLNEEWMAEHGRLQSKVFKEANNHTKRYNDILSRERAGEANIQKKYQAAGQTLANAKPKIQAMRELAKAAQPAAKPQASGSGESHAKALESLAKDFKHDHFISTYANELAKAARSGGEAGIAKRAEEIRNEIQGANTPGFQKSVQNGRLDYVLNEYKNGMAKQPAQPAPKPRASHPMANEVQRDIDYWHQMQYGGRPSEKQKQDTIESMRMQYDDYLKTAEKNWKLAQSVPDLDEATRNSFKQKYETAKGKVEALKQMHG